MILLDTDIMIDLLRKYHPAVAWLSSLGEEEIVLPGFVAMELLQGCRNKVEQEKVEATLQNYAIAWPSSETCDEALSLFADFHLTHALGLLDALFGATAIALKLPLCTFNQKHYAAIPDLTTVQPYEKSVPAKIPRNT
jgi:predicted nucleic acid-binding protein